MNISLDDIFIDAEFRQACFFPPDTLYWDSHGSGTAFLLSMVHLPDICMDYPLFTMVCSGQISAQRPQCRQWF